MKTCWNCNAVNGVVRKIPGAAATKISHDPQRATGAEGRAAYAADFATAVSLNPDLEPLVVKSKEVLSPLDALRILRAIPDEDCDLVWMDAKFGRPESMIITHVIVPPVCIRPSVAMDAGAFTEDDITVKLQVREGACMFGIRMPSSVVRLS